MAKPKCEYCGLEDCQPKSYILCPLCHGLGCDGCQASPIPGIIDGHCDEDEGGNLTACSTFSDPVINALMDDTMETLKDSMIWARDKMIEDYDRHNA